MTGIRCQACRRRSGTRQRLLRWGSLETSTGLRGSLFEPPREFRILQYRAREVDQRLAARFGVRGLAAAISVDV